MTHGGDNTEVSAAELALLDAWRNIEERVPRNALSQEVQLSIATARALAEGHALNVERLSETWGLPLEQTEQIFNAAKGRSIETDQDDQLIGAAGLSLNRTDYELAIRGRTMYAWCAWDALFLPAYLDASATVTSTDPVDGELITVEVSPTSIGRAEPDTTVLTILVPNLDSPEGLQTGPGTARCSAMHFFTDKATAVKWVGDRTDLVILNPTQALDIAQRTWLSLTP